MEEAKLLKTNKVKGLFVYCTKCKLKVTDKCGSTGKRIASCKDKEKHRYKVIVKIPGGNGAAKTKLLETKDENEAVLQTFAYKAELEKSNYSTKLAVIKTEIPRTVLEAMAYYLAYLENDTPHEQEHKQRSKAYKEEVGRYFNYFSDYLQKEMDINSSIFQFEKLDKNVVGKLKSYLLITRNYAPKTYNKFVGLMRIFVNFMMEEFEYRMKNPFKAFKRLQVEIKINTIENKEFHALLEIIQPDGSQQEFETRGPDKNKKKKKYKKNRYKPWLRDAMMLALLTGRRREEIVCMKFNGITENEAGEPMTICIEDFKVNRGNSLTNKEARKKIYVPVITPLKKLLYELGYTENKGKDRYILAPAETMERRTMMDFISKSFSFYYKKLNTGKDLTFYDLRKTYISHLYATHGEKAKIITKHSGLDVMLDHYIDEKVISEIAMDFGLFGL